MPLTKNQTLYDRYRINALLAQGGMGAVYDGFDTRLNVRCAIKENLLFTEASTRQFEREAKMLAALRHPNLPRVTDHFIIPGQGQYLVMDFVEGEDLNQRLKRLGPLPEDDVLRWADDVLNALAYLHKRNIIHRDIKPNNVKITPDGEAVLVDFGIAKEMVDETGAMTNTGARGLTPGFAPPEQYGAWSGRTDARSDIYAFGATLYVLLTGEAPADALSRMTKPEKFVPLARHRVKVSEPLAEAIDRALTLEPEERWQSAEEMRERLKKSGDKMPPDLPAPAKVEEESVKHRESKNRLKPHLRSLPDYIWKWVGMIGGVLALSMVTFGLIASRGTFRPKTAALTSPPPILTLTPTLTESATVAQRAAPTITPIPTSPSKTPTHTPIPTNSSVLFTPVDLSSVANISFTAGFLNPPLGSVTLDNIPFELDDNVFSSQSSTTLDRPTEARLTVSVLYPRHLYVLMGAGNGYWRFNSKSIGKIELMFKSGNSLVVDIVLGRNIREWQTGSNATVSRASDATEVWRGPMAFAPAYDAVLDLLAIPIPEEYRSDTLVEINFYDTSLQNLNSYDPAIGVNGVSVAHR